MLNTLEYLQKILKDVRKKIQAQAVKPGFLKMK